MPSNSQILSAQRARVWLAPVGTAAPVDATTTPAAPWRNVGLTKEDSLSLSVTPEFEEVTSHQSDFPTRTLPTTQSATLSVDLQQWNGDNMKSVFGGGTIVETSAGSKVYKFTPPNLGDRVELTAMIEVLDGTKAYRWIFVRTMQKEGVEAEMQKNQEARLPLRLSVQGDDGVVPWYLITNDPAYAPS